MDRAELARVSEISGGESYTASSAGGRSKTFTGISEARLVRRRWTGKSLPAMPVFGLGFAISYALGMISLGARWP